MQDIAIRLAVAIENLPARLRDEEGQTAVEYAGILALIATIFVLLFGLGLDHKLSDVVNHAINKITSGKE